MSEGDTHFVKFQTVSISYENNEIFDGFVQPCYSGPLAQYKVTKQTMEFCYRKDDDDDDLLTAATRHEMFHAFQHHFDVLSADVNSVTVNDHCCPIGAKEVARFQIWRGTRALDTTR